MSSYALSSWTPTLTTITRKTTAIQDQDVCITCNRKLPKLDKNLLKDSLRMKSEVAQMNTQRKSLMRMMERNDDFFYAITPQPSKARASTLDSMSATSKLINDDRNQSVLNNYAQVMKNRELHDCEKLHTHSRKREYKKWDFAHKDLAKYHLKPIDHQMELWLEEEEDSPRSDDVKEEDMREGKETKLASRVHFEPGWISGADGRATRRELVSRDAEEDIPEEERVKMAIEKIRNELSGGLLMEIHQIKDRHKQLEALTATKKRAMAESVKPKKSHKKIKEKVTDKDALRKFLLANANIQKDLEFNSFKEKTTVKLNRNFNNMSEAKTPGVVWAPKWNPNPSHVPGKISKSTHPVSDANKKQPKPTFIPAKPGDLPPCVYLPKHVEAKTPMESALLLERFMKETIRA